MEERRIPRKLKHKTFLVSTSTETLRQLSKLLLRATRIPITSGYCSKEEGIIYLLWQDNEIVYIGQTTKHPFIRLGTHLSNKKFDAYSFIQVPLDCLDDLELVLIQELEPKFNRKGKDIAIYTSDVFPLNNKEL